MDDGEIGVYQVTGVPYTIRKKTTIIKYRVLHCMLLFW